MRFAVLNGPNLGRLGQREPELYGSVTHDELAARCIAWGDERGHRVRVAQTNGEGDLIRLIHAADDDSDGILLNAAAYTHTSVAVRDAVLSISAPVVEIHLTNPWAREDFRRRNLLSDVVVARIAGFGPAGYLLALSGLADLLGAGN